VSDGDSTVEGGRIIYKKMITLKGWIIFADRINLKYLNTAISESVRQDLLIVLVGTYVAVTWTLTENDKRIINTFEMRHYTESSTK